MQYMEAAENNVIRYFKTTNGYLYMDILIDYQSFWTAAIIAMFEGGRSLDITAAKKNPTKKIEPIDINNHPQNLLSVEFITDGLNEDMLITLDRCQPVPRKKLKR